jgi:hypothetical protein
MSQSPKTITNVQQIDPAIKPYVESGLQAARTMYENPQDYYPQYYGGQTYVNPSDQTSAALLALKNRATQGNMLNPNAQAQQLGTIQGQYLSGNPFFGGAFAGAAQQAGNVYNQSVNQALSNASRAGRYGSNAMGSTLGAAGTTLANSLANTAGQLAYQNYDAERSRQQAASMAAPSLAQQDYYDINQLYQAGQQQEAYDQAKLQADINRFNYNQQIPQNSLQQYMSYVYGAPMGSVGSQQVYANTGANLLGGAATLGGLANKAGLGAGGTATAAAIGAALGLI